MQSELLECECSSPEHLMIVSYTPDHDVVTLTVHLKRKPILTRLYHAIMYIFGYKSEFGNFDEVLFRKSDASRLISILTRFVEKAD